MFRRSLAPFALAALLAAVIAAPAACTSSSSAPASTGGGTTTTSTGAGGATGWGGASSGGAGQGGAAGEGGAGGAGGAAMVCDPGHPDVSGEPSCGVSPVKPAQPTITLSLTVSDLTTQAPLKGLTVKACARDDGDCGAPLATETTDAAGKVSVTVPSGTDGFDGYAMITGDNVVPELLFPSPPVTMDAEFFTGVATPNSLNLLSIIYGTTIDPSRGAVAAVMSDCDGKSVGLTLDVGSADGCTVIGYAENQLPSADAKATDASGVGFALNIPPGRPTLVSRDGNGAVLGRTEILVKPSTLTAVSLRPTP